MREHTDQFQLLRESAVGLERAATRGREACSFPFATTTRSRHLDLAVQETDTDVRDVIVLTIRLLTGPDAGVEDIEREELFTDYEQLLFTRVVAIAERHGRTVKLLVVPSTNVFDAVAQTAILLRAREIVVGESAKMPAAEQARLLGEAWDRTPHPPDISTRLIVHGPGGATAFLLGAHAPELSPDDVDRIHRLWVDACDALAPRFIIGTSSRRRSRPSKMISRSDRTRRLIAFDGGSAVHKFKLPSTCGAALAVAMALAAGQASAQTAPADASAKPEPFAFADFTWLTGNPRTKESPLDSKVFTGEFRVDTNFTYSFNQPKDDTIVRIERGLPIRRNPGDAARHRRRLPLRQRARPR